MSANTTTAEESNGIEKRTKRAATESMSLDRYAGNAGEYDVHSESGSVYRVDLIAGSCSCPDDEHNAPAGGCKHVRRVEIATGQRPVPELGQETDVERMIDARADQTDAQTDHQEVATDGGAVVESDQTGDQRPDDCDCSEHFDSGELGCWPCYRDGFETANPDPSNDYSIHQK